MQDVRILVVVVGLWLPVAAQAAENPAEPSATSGQSAEAGTPAKCLEAAVNPVTGFAVCVNPVGAPVDPPPASAFQPCKPRAHDNDAFTVYERSSGCGD